MNDKAFEEVRTENLLLRMPNSGDLPAILAIEGNPETNRYRPAGPMKNLNEAEESLKRWQKDWFTNGYGYWAVILPSKSELIEMAQKYLPHLSVIARIRPCNKPSQRVAKRIGLRHCPELDSAEHMVFK